MFSSQRLRDPHLGGLNTEGTTPCHVPKAPAHARVPNPLNRPGLLLHLSGLLFLSGSINNVGSQTLCQKQSKTQGLALPL